MHNDELRTNIVTENGLMGKQPLVLLQFSSKILMRSRIVDWSWDTSSELIEWPSLKLKIKVINSKAKGEAAKAHKQS